MCVRECVYVCEKERERENEGDKTGVVLRSHLDLGLRPLTPHPPLPPPPPTNCGKIKRFSFCPPSLWFFITAAWTDEHTRQKGKHFPEELARFPP